MTDAVDRLSHLPATAVYIDAGNPGWVPAAVMARRLRAVGIVGRAGLRGQRVGLRDHGARRWPSGARSRAAPRGAHFVIDTSRNGLGPLSRRRVVQPAGRARSASGPAPRPATRWSTPSSGSSGRASRTGSATAALPPGAGGPSTPWASPSEPPRPDPPRLGGSAPQADPARRSGAGAPITDVQTHRSSHERPRTARMPPLTSKTARTPAATTRRLPSSASRIAQILSLAALLAAGGYLVWRWGFTLEGSALWLGIPLALAETYGLVMLGLLTFSCWRLADRPTPEPLDGPWRGHPDRDLRRGRGRAAPDRRRRPGQCATTSRRRSGCSTTAAARGSRRCARRSAPAT